MEKKGKVFVGLSGGVDSSVSAAILKEAGYDVTGVFIKVWQPDFIECTRETDRLDAIRVSAELDIPFIELDLENEYKRDVLDYTVRSYERGHTPNPDVWCNRYIKFGAFWDFAKKNGANFIATGHYARIINGGEKESGYKLLKGIDENKDQSYFLWTLRQEDLAHIIFPVGGMKKPEVRKLAKKFGLSISEKKDSQGLCFMGKLDMKEFLSHFMEKNPGEVFNEKGEVIGKHEGAMFFTLGERHGFTITKKTSEDKPYYVVAKDIKNNRITVSEEKLRSSGARTKIMLKDTNWIGREPKDGGEYEVQFRYRQIPVEGVFSRGVLEVKEPQLVDSDQSAVIYDGDCVMGGGSIA